MRNQKQNRSRILLATRNVHKFDEVKEILRELPIELTSLLDFPEIPEIDEVGKTFAENATLKARTAFHKTGILSIADDSGLEVDFLAGAPGVYSARFASDSHDYSANNSKLLDMLKDVPSARRGAQFRCVGAIIDRDFEETVQGIVRGQIITELRGDRGFGYDPLFIPEGYDQTFAELGEEVKNKISHRALAFQQVKEVLRRLLQ
jgi:XTP/dITP diphosphohydrolase